MTQINAYDDYGIPQGKTPSGAVYAGGTTTANFGRFGYTGQAWLPEIGLYHYKARAYSPTLGRFMQTDPIGYGDGVNLYAYVGGDPVNGRDPSGLLCIPNGTGIGGSNTPAQGVGCEGGTIVVTAQSGGPSFGGGLDLTSPVQSIDFSGANAQLRRAARAADAGQSTKGRNRCNDPVTGKPRAGLDAIEDVLQIASDGAGLAADGAAVFGLANALIGDEPGALASGAVALTADRIAVGLGLAKSALQFARGNFNGGIRTAARALTSNVASRLVTRIGAAAGGSTNLVGDVFSGQVGSKSQGIISDFICGPR